MSYVGASLLAIEAGHLHDHREQFCRVGRTALRFSPTVVARGQALGAVAQVVTDRL